MEKIQILSDKGTHYFVAGRKPHLRRKVRRFRCIGGPIDGAWRSGEEIVEEQLHRQYLSFNRSGGCFGASSVFIHKDIFT